MKLQFTLCNKPKTMISFLKKLLLPLKVYFSTFLSIILSYNAQAQNLTSFNYKVKATTSLFLTNFEDYYLLNDINKLRLSPAKEEVSYQLTYQNEALYKVVQTNIVNDYFNKGMCLPINTIYTDKILSNYCGIIEQMPFSEIDINAFFPKNYASFFNYIVNQELLDSLTNNGFSVDYYSDLTLHYWNDSVHYFKNKDKLTYNEVYIDQEGVPSEEKYLMVNYNGKYYKKMTQSNTFEPLDSGVVGIVETKQIFNYTSLESGNRLSNQDDIEFPQMDIDAKILYSKVLNPNQNSLILDKGACANFTINGLFDLHGKNISTSKINSISEIYLMGLKPGLYFVKYTCGMQNLSKTIVINN